MEFLRFCVFDKVTKASAGPTRMCVLCVEDYFRSSKHTKTIFFHRDVMSLRKCLAPRGRRIKCTLDFVNRVNFLYLSLKKFYLPRQTCAYDRLLPLLIYGSRNLLFVILYILNVWALY